MADTKQQKLGNLATRPVGDGLHIEPLPKLAELSMLNGFKRGQELFDEEAVRWVTNLEKAIKQYVAGSAKTAERVDGGAAE